MRLTNPKTLRASGCMGDQPVIVLIDPGATHNFTSLNLIEKMRIPMTATFGFGVQLLNGENIPTIGLCQGVRLHLHGIEIIEDFIPLKLGSTDVMWLETIGGTYINWKTQLLKFHLGNKIVSLGGIHPWVKPWSL